MLIILILPLILRQESWWIKIFNDWVNKYQILEIIIKQERIKMLKYKNMKKKFFFEKKGWRFILKYVVSLLPKRNKLTNVKHWLVEGPRGERFVFDLWKLNMIISKIPSGIIQDEKGPVQ